MSIHKSLATKGKLVRSRNVLKRAERIQELENAGKWNGETASPFGLPKVRVMKAKKRVKEKKKEEGAEGAAAKPGEAAPAAAPAAGKAPAAGGKAAAGKAPPAGAKAPAGKDSGKK